MCTRALSWHAARRNGLPMKTITHLALVLGLGCSVLSGAASAERRFTGNASIASTDAEQIVRAAIVNKFPGVIVQQVRSEKSASSAHRYSVVVVDGKTQLRGTVTIDLRAWSPRAGIDRVSAIRLPRARAGSEVARLDSDGK